MKNYRIEAVQTSNDGGNVKSPVAKESLQPVGPRGPIAQLVRAFGS